MNEVNEKLEELIPRYAQNKGEMDSYKRICDSENKEIKNIFANSDFTEYTAGGYVAKYTVQKRESMNEDRLLYLLKTEHSDLCEQLGIIAIKEYVDSDVLEAAIYNGDIPKEVLLKMDSCKEVKEVPTLKVSRVKEKKGE